MRVLWILGFVEEEEEEEELEVLELGETLSPRGCSSMPKIKSVEPSGRG